MKRVLAAIRGHPILSYFLLAYAISWIGIFGVVGVSGLRSGDLTISTGMLVWSLMLAGPGAAGILLTYLVAGREGLSDFRRRLLHWRVPRQWYATLLITPVVGSIIVASLSLISPDFRPMLLVESPAIVTVMFLVLIFGAAVEELGWTGYATPRMRLVYGYFGTALLLGTLHGAWHFLADFSGRADASPLLYFPRFVVFWIVGLFALRLLMVWVYEHTESLLLGQLIHASYTAPLFVLTPPNASAAQMLVLWTLFTAVFATVVLSLVFAHRLRRQVLIVGRTRRVSG
jgi:uncharacterized protein